MFNNVFFYPFININHNPQNVSIKKYLMWTNTPDLTSFLINETEETKQKNVVVKLDFTFLY